MLFNSYVFLFAFLPAVLAGWWGLSRWKPLRLAFLTGASWFFYAWWDWRYLPVLIGATSVDFLAGRWIAASASEPRRRLLLAASLTTNVGILAYFKYADFFFGSLNGIGRALGLGAGLPSLHILLPIGISFYTFNSMSYTIDIFRRRVEPTRNVLEYTTFVGLFPHLIAGPIVRFTDLADQLKRLTPRLTSETASRGMFFLSCGLVKKLLIADQPNPYVARLYSGHAYLGLLLGSHAVLRRAGWTPTSVTVNRAVTFLLVCSAFVIFRSPSLGVAGDVFSSMLGLHGLDSTARLHALLPATFALLTAALLV